MRLDGARCWDLLARSERGVLATVHPERGVDAVPVCFVAVPGRIAVPVDLVKPKEATDLQRVRNLDGDPRAALLCDHWDGDDWSQLWWVRASLARVEVAAAVRSEAEGLLSRKYSQYADRPFARVLVFGVREITGWSGAGGSPAAGEEGRAHV